MGNILKGKIVDIDRFGVTIRVNGMDWQEFGVRQYEEVSVEFHDGRHRSPEQNRKAWALMGEMADFFTGDKRNAHDDVYKPLSAEFTTRMEKSLEKKLFRLSQADMTQAREFISFLIDIALEYDVPTKEPLAAYADDIERYIFSCMMNKRCAVCGRKADLHHVDRVGMGRDRE